MRILVLALLISLCDLSQAATMAIPGLPGANLFYKNVQSIRERRFAIMVSRKPISVAAPPPSPPCCVRPTGWTSMKNR